MPHIQTLLNRVAPNLGFVRPFFLVEITTEVEGCGFSSTVVDGMKKFACRAGECSLLSDQSHPVDSTNDIL